MNKMNTDLIKDVVISILIVICIILIISIIFYNKLSFNKVIPEAEEYALPDEMLEDLNSSYTEDATQIVTTYYIDAADLKKYERTKEYNKGKQNPFAEESIAVEGESTLGDSTNDSTSTKTSENTNFYEDKGIK